MDKFLSIFLEPESKKLVYLTSNKIEDITHDRLFSHLLRKGRENLLHPGVEFGHRNELHR